MKDKTFLIGGAKLTQPMIDIICLLMYNVQVKNLHTHLKKPEGTTKTHNQRLHERLQLGSVQQIINWGRVPKHKHKLLKHCSVDLSSLGEISSA